MFIKVKIGTFNWPAVRAPANICFVIYNTYWDESECSEIDWDEVDRSWENKDCQGKPIWNSLKPPKLKALIVAQNSDDDC